jgi:hypothetical protein
MDAHLLRRARVVRSYDRRWPSATAAMWAGIAVSIMVLVVLLARGGGDAWTIAAGVLLVISTTTPGREIGSYAAP